MPNNLAKPIFVDYSKPLLLSICIFLISGCSNLSYYAQAVKGQWQVLSARENIKELLTRPNLSPERRKLFERILQARTFASEKLGLPDNKSYSTYADLKRKYVVWNVVAAPVDSFDLKTHCFPFAGCVVYKGFFKQEAAEEYALKLKQKQWETYVYGVRAYSTLGWFDDPILNTMTDGVSELYWIETLFHELVHQMIYVKDNSRFNEGLATAVAEIGVQLWEDEQPKKMRQFQQVKKERAIEFSELIDRYKRKLSSLYQQPYQETQKHQLYEKLKDDYALLKKTKWAGYTGYDQWVSKQLNNAKLGIYTTYNQDVDGIVDWFSYCELDVKMGLSLIQKAIKYMSSHSVLKAMKGLQCDFKNE